jgi:hypothetical protein
MYSRKKVGRFSLNDLRLEHEQEHECLLAPQFGGIVAAAGWMKRDRTNTGAVHTSLCGVVAQMRERKKYSTKDQLKSVLK